MEEQYILSDDILVQCVRAEIAVCVQTEQRFMLHHGRSTLVATSSLINTTGPITVGYGLSI